MTGRSIPVGVIVDGATGRLGGKVHLAEALTAIARDGGVPLANGDRAVPQPLLLGRDPDRLAAVAAANGGLPWSTDLDACLSDPDQSVYFDAAITAGRRDRAMKAIAAGKHIYLEKPMAASTAEAREILLAARTRGVRHGVVQDKLFLPGPAALTKLYRDGAFGRILSVRIDFGWWVFDGFERPMPRSPWNYRRAEGGGIVLDMFSHWLYLAESVAGPVRSVSCVTATRQGRRQWDGVPFDVDVEDEAFAIAETASGAIFQATSSWARRAGTGDIMTIRVDGTGASAEVGVHSLKLQRHEDAIVPVWHVTDPKVHAANVGDGWQEVATPTMPHPYRAGWEAYLSHVVSGTPFPSPLEAGLRGLAFIEACYRSAAERRQVALDGDTA